MQRTDDRRPPRDRQRCGFSLVELMIVIAVIVILIALLLPAVSMVRARSRQTQCSNNLKQLFVGWTKANLELKGTAHDPTQWSTKLLPYLDNQNAILACPDKTSSAPASYGLSNRSHRLSGDRGDAGRIVMVDFDTPDANVVVNVFNTCQDAWKNGGAVAADYASPGPAARHFKQQNALFLAGHVEPKSPDAIDPRYCDYFKKYWRPSHDEKTIDLQNCLALGSPPPSGTGGSSTTTTGGAATGGSTTTSTSTTTTTTTTTTGGSSTTTTTSTTGGTTTGGQTVAPLCPLDEQYGFYQDGAYAHSGQGTGKFIRATNNISGGTLGWYVIDSSGYLRRWISGSTYGTQLAYVGMDVYNDPSILHDAFTGDCNGTDLAITKSVSSGWAAIGSTMTYTIKVTNLGLTAATGVRVTDSLPGGVTFASANASQGTTQFANPALTANLGTVAGNTTATVTVNVTVNAGASGTICNTATFTTYTNDPNSSNNAIPSPGACFNVGPPPPCSSLDAYPCAQDSSTACGGNGTGRISPAPSPGQGVGPVVRYIWIRQASAITAAGLPTTGLLLTNINLEEFQAFDQNGVNVAAAANGGTVADIQTPYTAWGTWNGALIDNNAPLICNIPDPRSEAPYLAHSGDWVPGWMLIYLGPQGKDIRSVRLVHRPCWQARREMGVAIELHQNDPRAGGEIPVWRKCIPCSNPLSDLNSPCGPVHEFPVCP